ncbi:MAG TPA: M28 family peptidase [Gemmatimonadaceae bacterium]|nr:M28 family peptidase [Gemmatimonadaceae bacterium]
MRSGAGTEHLAAIARGPRAAGSDGERAAREYAMDVLRTAGFDVATETFHYSALPGRRGTPLGSALALATVLASSWAFLEASSPRTAAGILATGLVLLVIAARRMLGDGVLTIPLMRASGVNVVARRPSDDSPRVWLVAHVDSKSQPVPSALRVAGIVLLALGIAAAIVAAALTLGGAPPRTLWWIAATLATGGAIPAMLSVVGNDSDGAVDNASGVAAVLAAAQSLSAEARVGVLLPSAEELGLAGARAWVRGWHAETGIALNCDGVDDDGALTIMYTGRRPDALVRALENAAERTPRVRRMPLGLLTDSVAFADAGWQTATVSRGSLRTLRRVHTRRDSLANLRGDGIAEVSALLAKSAEALAR